MKKRYALIWSKMHHEWICADITDKPKEISNREYAIGNIFNFNLTRYIGA